MATKKKHSNFSIKLYPDGDVKHLEALGHDSSSLVLTIYGSDREARSFAGDDGPAYVQCITMRFDALAVDRLIACLAKALDYDVVTDIKVLTEKLEFEDAPSRVYIIDNFMCPISISLCRDSALRISLMNLNFNREDFMFTIYPDSARGLLKEIGPLYGWKLQG